MAEKQNIPEIRFEGFTDPWEQRKLGGLFFESNERSSSMEILSVSVAKGIYPASESNRDTNPGASLANYKVVHKGDVVYNSMRMWQGAVGSSDYDGIVSPAYVVARPVIELDSTCFGYLLKRPEMLYKYLCDSQGNSKDTQTLKYNRFADIEVTMPVNLEEQRVISACLGRVDTLITLHQRKCQYRSLYGYLSWEQRKLGELYSLVSEKNDLTFGRESIISVANMYFNANVNVTDEQYLRTYNVMRLGDIAFEGHSNKEFSHGRFVENYIGDGIVSHIFTVLRPRVPFDVNYWRYAINNEKLMRLSLIRSTKASTMMHDLVPSDFLREAIPTPTLAEQKEIGAFLVGLDHLITLHQRKYDKLCTVKKSMLDKMFPKPGETEPEIRFEGFTDPWEQRKLGELGFAQSGIGFPDAEQGGTEGTPFFKVSDMNTPGNEYELVASNNYVTAEQIARMGWRPINQVPAIFFAKVGAAVMLNRKRLINEPFLLDNNTMAFSMDSSLLDTQFGQSLFERLDLTSLIQVGALPSFNSSDVESIFVSLPSTMNEQRQIGQYLCDLNTLITLHQ